MERCFRLSLLSTTGIESRPTILGPLTIGILGIEVFSSSLSFTGTKNPIFDNNHKRKSSDKIFRAYTYRQYIIISVEQEGTGGADAAIDEHVCIAR